MNYDGQKSRTSWPHFSDGLKLVTMKDNLRKSPPGLSTTTSTARRGFSHVSARCSMSWHQIRS